MRLNAQQVLAQVDRLIEEARPEELPALSAALSARVSVATARLLETPPERDRGPDQNLSVEEAAGRLGVSGDWLYKQRNLPFRRKIGRRVLFSAKGLEKWNRQRQEG